MALVGKEMTSRARLDECETCWPKSLFIGQNPVLHRKQTLAGRGHLVHVFFEKRFT